MEDLRQLFLRSPMNPITQSIMKLSMPKSTIENSLYKHLRLHANKIPMKQPLHVCRATEELKLKFSI